NRDADDSLAEVSLIITLRSRVAVDVLGIEGGLEAALTSPGVEIGKRIHHPPAELMKARPAADHPLLLQRARRQPQEVRCFAVGEIARGRAGLWCLRLASTLN